MLTWKWKGRLRSGRIKFRELEMGAAVMGNPLLLWIFTLLYLHATSLLAPAAGAAEDGDTIVVTAEEIRAMQALKIADVLNNVPGVRAGDASVGIHGSYKVKVFVDGRSINNPTSSHGGVNWDMVSPDDVEQIEILRGKGGLTYGQDAGGGVILITTKNIQRFSGNIKTYAGNNDTRNISAAVSTTAGDLAVGVSGGYETTHGYKINNDKERYQAGIKLSCKTGRSDTIVFSADYLEDQRGLSGLPEHPTPYSRKKTRNGAYALQADFKKLQSKTDYNVGYQHNTDISKGLDNTLMVSKFGQNLTTTFKTTEQGELSCGGGFAWNRAHGTAFDDQEEHSAALFAAQSLAWSRYHIALTAGLRANYHSAFENTVNPEIKLVYKRPTWRLTAAYSRTHNTPSFYQRYNETSSTRPNPDLEMERADNHSLSLFAAPHDSFSLSLSGFYNLLTDRITYITGDDGMGQYQNFGDVLYTGGDLALSWKIHPAVKVKTAYTYLEAKDRETDLWLPGKARHNANLDLYWQPRRPFSLVASGKYSSKVYRNKSNTKTVPAYVIADMRAEYGFKRFSIFGEIKNVFNKTRYYADGLLAPPRTWVMGVNWRI